MTGNSFKARSVNTNSVKARTLFDRVRTVFGNALCRVFDALSWGFGPVSLAVRAALLPDTKRGVLGVKFVRLNPNAVEPCRATQGSAGFDLTAVSCTHDAGRGVYTYGTGLAVEIPDGYVGLLFPRSSIFKFDLALTNGVGVLDSDYRGEIKFVFSRRYTSEDGAVYHLGDRIGQLVLVHIPDVTFYETCELSRTERGAGGYGSTGGC